MQTVDAVRDQVKSELVQQFSTTVDGLFDLAMADASPRELEAATWEALLVEGASTLGALLADRARRVSEQDAAERYSRVALPMPLPVLVQASAAVH